ncbi:MAG: 3,4-dihydroxy-2-butanone-4-phosphate synthase [Candidatus Altiarchaeota archaeon]
MSNLEKAIENLKAGRFILVHDSGEREDETDMVLAAESATKEKIARMRLDAGGLICVAVGKSISERLGLPYMHDMQQDSSDKYPVLAKIVANDIPYDEKSSFSVAVNHRKTFTGITDEDRALTIREFGKLCESPTIDDFGKSFRSPGHVHLLRSSGLENRQGHTELSTALMRGASLTECAVICEMLDGRTYTSLKAEKAREYAKKNRLVMLETDEIIEAYGR